MQNSKISLSPQKLSKRVNDALYDMIDVNILETKGGVIILKEVQKILLLNIPALQDEIRNLKIVVAICKLLLACIAVAIFSFVVTPNPSDVLSYNSTIDKANFVNSFMSLVVGLIVSVVSASLWAKNKAYAKVKMLIDQLHILMHRLDMIQLGKKKHEIITPWTENSQTQLEAYLRGVVVGISICGKTAALIRHMADDESISRACSHLETTSHSLIASVRLDWPEAFSRP